MNTLANTAFSHIRGCNYRPGYAGRLAMIWTNFDRSVREREVARSNRFGTTARGPWVE